MGNDIQEIEKRLYTPDNVARYIIMQIAIGNPAWKINGKRIKK